MKVEISSRPEDLNVGVMGRLVQHSLWQPSAIAIRCGPEELSYHEMARKIYQGSVKLRQVGCKEGDRIAILSQNCLNFIPAFFAAIATGGSAVTIPTILTPEGIATILDDCNPCAVIVAFDQNALLEAALEIANAKPTVISLDAPDFRRNHLFEEVPEGNFDLAAAVPDDLEREFNIVYSSGTTGKPKGILHSHKTRSALASGMSGLGFDRKCVTLISTPLFTNMSIPAFLATLWGGGTVSVIAKFEPGAFLKIASEGASHFFLVPVQVQRIFDQVDFGQFDLSSTRLKYVAGSVLAPELKRRLLDDWPGSFVEVYGTTEGAPVAYLAASEHLDKLKSVGRPPEGSKIAIIDDDDNRLAEGVVGEVVGCTNFMMIGYHNLPDETAAIEWTDEHGDRYFRSGDLGYLDKEGYLYIVGRKKDVIISGGYNIYSSDLEQALLDHPDVQDAAVVGIKSHEWGETPIGFVEMKSNSSVSKQALLEFANGKLGRFQRLSSIVVVRELPRNALGKVVKRDLSEQWNDR